MIERTFFITALGRSGTSFLAALMNRSDTYRVVHEWHLPLPGFEDLRLRRFPIHRFQFARRPFKNFRRGYGEVNSYLRFHIDPRQPGPEVRIPRKGIIRRDPAGVITSVMNRGGRTIEDFPLVCDRISRMYWNLNAIAEARSDEFAVFEFDRMVGEVQYAQDILSFVGIDDVTVTATDLGTKVNVNQAHWFPPLEDWANEHLDLYHSMNEKFGTGDPPEMPDIG